MLTIYSDFGKRDCTSINLEFRFMFTFDARWLSARNIWNTCSRSASTGEGRSAQGFAIGVGDELSTAVSSTSKTCITLLVSRRSGESPEITSTMRTNASTKQKPKVRYNRKLTSVALEPAVMDYLDNLATRMRMNRSFVLNSIVHEYAKLIENRTIQVEEIIRA